MDNFKFFIKYYLPALIWAGIIFYFSNIPNLKYSEAAASEIILRKGAHFIEYAILAFLVWRLFYYGHEISARRSFFYSFALVSLYALSDEFHQTLVFGRSGRIADAAYDTISVFIGLEFMLAIAFKKITRKILFFILTAFTILAFIEYGMIKEAENMGIPVVSSPLSFNSLDVSVEPEENSDENSNLNSLSEKKIPSEIFIKVPFTSQAPFADWDVYHEEACEEASLIMVKYFLDGKNLNPDLAEEEIQNMIKFEIDNYGSYKDTSAGETVQLAKDFYGIGNMKVIYNFSLNDIKKYLAEGKPIIIPAAGRKLGNPYYTAPGPPYHMLVLVGYKRNMVITNDPGTKRGKGYQYDINILYSAIHDFTGNIEDIEQGRKAMIILE